MSDILGVYNNYFLTDSTSIWPAISFEYSLPAVPALPIPMTSSSNPFSLNLEEPTIYGVGNMSKPWENFDFYNTNYNFTNYDLSTPKYDLTPSKYDLSTPKYDLTSSKESLFTKAKRYSKPKSTTYSPKFYSSNKSRDVVKKSSTHPRLYTTQVNGYTIHTLGGGINVSGLKQETKNKLVSLAKEAEKHGYTVYVSSGFRSHASQADLKNRKPGLAASQYRSPHEYGCAFDIGLLNEKGQKVDIKNVSWFHKYATDTLGLEWGQNWTRWTKESWHFNLKNWQYRSDVKGEYLAYNGKLPNGNRA